MSAIMTSKSTNGSTTGYVLNPNVDILKTTTTDTKNGVAYQITTYTAAPKQLLVGDYATYLKPVGLAFLALGLIGMVFTFTRLKSVNLNDSQKRLVLALSSLSILAGTAMIIFSRSVPLPSK